MTCRFCLLENTRENLQQKDQSLFLGGFNLPTFSQVGGFSLALYNEQYLWLYKIFKELTTLRVYGVSTFYYQGRGEPLNKAHSMSALSEVLRIKSPQSFKILRALRINEPGFLMDLPICRTYLGDYLKKIKLRVKCLKIAWWYIKINYFWRKF